jgi:hypothetical protein
MTIVVQWAERFGYRNIAYAAFIACLFPFAALVEAGGPHGPDAGSGVVTAIMLWVAVSVVFFLVNAVLSVIALAKGRSPVKSLIACALPILCIVLPLIAEPLFTR